MEIGDYVLYASLFAAASAAVMLLGEELKGIKLERKIRFLIGAFAVLLTFDFLLLTNYFLKTDLRFTYVWSFSEKHLPLIYKLSGTLAGQQGTLLFWAALIALGSLWLSERGGKNSLIRRGIIVLLVLGIYFVFLTLIESPFTTFHQINPNMPLWALPEEGAGLNPLLIDPWMAIHPPLVFVAYGVLALPFAVSMIYLIYFIRGDSGSVHGIWMKSIKRWCRVSWLFLTLGIAIGGFWAYKVLGWGGFWSWDPVETSSLTPWLMLTGALHAISEHEKSEERYTLLAPFMVSLSFLLVLYATLVTRSGFFESVHAFSSGNVGFYLVILIAVCLISTLSLGVLGYLKEEAEEEEKDSSMLSRSNVFYMTVLSFLLLSFISLWGITFPALFKLFSGRKVSIGTAFFNIWSYPLVIALMLLAGLCFRYGTAKKEGVVREFLVILLLTLVTMLIKPGEAWNIVDYSAVIGPQKPALYTLIGSVSILSFLPPSYYLMTSLIERGEKRMKRIKRRDARIKELSTLCIHVGIVFIIIGASFSMMFTSEFSATLNTNMEGVLVPSGENEEMGIMLLDLKEFDVYAEEVEAPASGFSIPEFYGLLMSGDFRERYTVHGTVVEKIDVGHNIYLRIAEGNEELWVATERGEFETGEEVVANGMLMSNFDSPTLNRTFHIVMFANEVVPLDGVIRRKVSSNQEVELAVYRGGKMLGKGKASVVTYKSGDVRRVMIDRSLFRDVYVIFTGVSGMSIPITIKIVPLINELRPPASFLSYRPCLRVRWDTDSDPSS